MLSAGSLNNTLMVVVIIATLTVTVLSTGEGHTYKDEDIPKDHYMKIWIITREGDTIYYSVSVERGSRIDVYFLNESESQRYIDGKSFLPDQEHIGATSVSGEFRVPDDQDYLIIIDNQDNAQENDTQPSGDVRIDAEITSSLVIADDSEPALFRMIMLPFIFLSIGILAMRGDALRRRRIREKRKKEFLSGVRGGPFAPSPTTQTRQAPSRPEQLEPLRPISPEEVWARGKP